MTDTPPESRCGGCGMRIPTDGHTLDCPRASQGDLRQLRADFREALPTPTDTTPAVEPFTAPIDDPVWKYWARVRTRILRELSGPQRLYVSVEEVLHIMREERGRDGRPANSRSPSEPNADMLDAEATDGD